MTLLGIEREKSRDLRGSNMIFGNPLFLALTKLVSSSSRTSLQSTAGCRLITWSHVLIYLGCNPINICFLGNKPHCMQWGLFLSRHA